MSQTLGNEPRKPPTGFFVTALPAGGVDLRVNGKGRGAVIALGTFLGAGWLALVGWDLAQHRALPLAMSLTAAVTLGLLALLFSFWCACADEVWHLEQNLLEHRVGIGEFCYRRQYQNAELEMSVASNMRGYRSYRLHAVTGGTRHFVMDRLTQGDLIEFADFVGAYTGWRIH